MTQRTIQQNRETYAIHHWGEGYFDINSAGHLVAHPRPDQEHSGIDIKQLADEVQTSGLSLPVLLRFNDILHHRLDALQQAFTNAKAVDDYQGKFSAVYPIKVNQQRRVVEEIASHDGVGLEAGSKPELMAVMALADANGGIIVCNGYKDREYIRLALIAQKLGHRVYIVIEKLSEVALVIKEARKLGVTPLLGIRARMAAVINGNWQNTGGAKAKFGLSPAAILNVIHRLDEAGLLSSLQMLHIHMGSQIANIRDIQSGMHECARHYAELRRLGAPIHTVDVGGGLGVDYEGTRSRSFCSANYNLQEYANNIVHTLWETCNAESIPHPHIFTECGRAITAHHAVLITNVIDRDEPPAQQSLTLDEQTPMVLHDLHQTLAAIDQRSPLESHHDASHWLSEAQTMYTHGLLTLEQRAAAETLHIQICHQVRQRLQPSIRTHREILDELNQRLADKVFCNFSLFQSMPDVWAIQQIFPIVPLHRLDETPNRHTILEDITCDSDGRIDQYVNRDGIEATLPLHAIEPGTPYLLGFFLVGAYQEILGDMHNLFGDTDSVNVAITDDGYELDEPSQGHSVDMLLEYVNYDPDALLDRYEEKLNAQDVPESTRTELLQELRQGLEGYTYLEE